jgi:hypothetical protein
MAVVVGLPASLVALLQSIAAQFAFRAGVERRIFPDRYDRLTSVIVLLVFAPIGPWFFRSNRLAHCHEPVTPSQLHPEPWETTATQLV